MFTDLFTNLIVVLIIYILINLFFLDSDSASQKTWELDKCDQRINLKADIAINAI